MGETDKKEKALSINPATEEVIAEHEYETTEEALSKISEMKESFLIWRRLGIEQRSEFIRKVGDELLRQKEECARLITTEMGKPIKQSISEIEKCASTCYFFAEKAKEFLSPEYVNVDNADETYIEFDPLGVILAIMPWNFPFWQVIRCAIPAIAAGNVVLLKHSPNTFLCSKKIEEIFSIKQKEAKPVLKNIFLKVEEIKNIIPEVQGVALTGSVKAGESVGELAGKNIKPFVLELGGSDPFIVLEDANIEKAVDTAIRSRMINSGQSCIASKRFLIHEKVYDKFRKILLEKVAKLKVGDPLDDVDIGPIARYDLFQNAIRIIEETKKVSGADVKVTGGRRLKAPGFFFEPAVIEGADVNSPCFQEETFAPIMPLFKFKNEEEAIYLANKTDFGLGATIFTKDMKRAKEMARYIEAGNIFINHVVRSDPRLPFGGVKKSGIGRELSRYGILEFVNIKTVSVKIL